MRTKYKDPCDKCDSFDYCIGFDDIILCPKCYKEALKKDELKCKKSISEKTKPKDINDKKKEKIKKNYYK